MLTENQEKIIDSLNAANWQQIKQAFGGQSAEEIKAELDKMFWSEMDTNEELAQDIFDELS